MYHDMSQITRYLPINIVRDIVYVCGDAWRSSHAAWSYRTWEVRYCVTFHFPKQRLLMSRAFSRCVLYLYVALNGEDRAG